jgi:DNA-binding MarR family transcriptional regulator
MSESGMGLGNEEAPGTGKARAPRRLTSAELRQLADFRYHLRRFLHFSHAAAEAMGLRTQQHQLLLAVCGMPAGEEPTIANVASRMFLKHNSTVELVDRTIEQGLMRRVQDPMDQRRILLRLTPHGEEILHALSAHHLEEMESAGPELIRSLRNVLGTPRGEVARRKGAA